MPESARADRNRATGFCSFVMLAFMIGGVSDDAVALSARNCAARALAQQDRPTQMIQPGGKTLSARPDRLSGGMPMCATGRREARIVILLAEDDVHVLHA
jgi:hypothetical protein